MSLYGLSHAILAEVVDVWAEQSVPLPALQYVAEGPFSSVSFDCEQVVVAVDGLNRGAPGAPQGAYQKRPMEWSVNVSIAVLRLCMAMSEDESPPLAEDHHAAAAETMGDLDILWRNAKRLLTASGCTHHSVSSAELVEVQGSIGGARLTASLDLLSV